MIINVISTGSSGNLYELIDRNGNSIILEAGMPRTTFAKFREGDIPPEMCIITHSHGDHSYYANDYEMICPVHKWEPLAVSENFKAFGYKVKHGDVLNYAYLIGLIQDDQLLFFATDLEYEEESFKPIWADLKRFKVNKFLIECNYNDYLYSLATDEQKIGCDRHFSDNDLVRFLRRVGATDPKVITIHGSNRLSTDVYTRKYVGAKFPSGTIRVATGVKNGVKNIFIL